MFKNLKHSKTCVKRPLKNRQNKDLDYEWKSIIGLKNQFLSEWLIYTGFTVVALLAQKGLDIQCRPRSDCLISVFPGYCSDKHLVISEREVFEVLENLPYQYLHRIKYIFMKCEYHIIFQLQINIAKNQNNKLKNKNGKKLQYSFNTKKNCH